MSIPFDTFILENFKISKFSKFVSFEAITLYSYSHLIVKSLYKSSKLRCFWRTKNVFDHIKRRSIHLLKVIYKKNVKTTTLEVETINFLYT